RLVRREPAFDAPAFAASAPTPRPTPASAPARANPVVHDEDDDIAFVSAEPPRPAPSPAPSAVVETPLSRVGPLPVAPKPGKRLAQETQALPRPDGEYQLPPLAHLTEPKKSSAAAVSADALEQNATLLEST